jgi:hypothetical protein
MERGDGPDHRAIHVTSAALVVLALVVQQSGYDSSFRAIAIAWVPRYCLPAPWPGCGCSTPRMRPRVWSGG